MKKGQVVIFSDNKRGIVKTVGKFTITVVPDYETKSWESATIPFDMVKTQTVIVARFPAEKQVAKYAIFPSEG